MNLKLNALVLISMAGYTSMASSEAVTGKIVIDGKAYSSESSIVIEGGNVIQGSGSVLEGSGNFVTKHRKLNAFDNLQINISADIDYIASDEYKIELSADDNIIAALSTDVRGNSLVVDTDQSFTTRSRIHVVIYGPTALKSIEIDGSSDISLKGLSSNSFNISLDGTGDIKAEGSVRDLTIDVDGSGSVNTKALQADNVSIDVDGSTNVTVTANTKLDVTIDGVSNVTYYGNPSSINKSVDGVGTVSAGN